MGSRVVGAEAVYTAAAAWVDRGLRTDDSLFTPGRPIWRTEWLDELRRRFLDRPDESGDAFLVKLERQMAGSSPEAFQLMAEVLYVHQLFPNPSNITGATKRENVETILEWSSQPTTTIPSELVASLNAGLANTGTSFNTQRDKLVGLIIEFASSWKQLQRQECSQLLDDPWAFKTFVERLDFESGLLAEYWNRAILQQQQALLHLVHPDAFEPIVILDYKNKIAKAFGSLVKDAGQDVDRQLQEIRSALENNSRTMVPLLGSGNPVPVGHLQNSRRLG